MRHKGYTFILALLYVFVIPWYLPQTTLHLYGFPLWIWIIATIHISISITVSLYLLTTKKIKTPADYSHHKGSQDD